MSLDKFLFLLINKQLYLSRVDQFSDKAEVLVTQKEVDYWNKSFHLDIKTTCETYRTTIYANCWIKSQNEVSTMWSSYASDKDGIAIRSTVKRLIDSYSGDLSVVIVDVNYIDHHLETVLPSNEPPNGIRFYTTKRLSYKAENEIRLIYDVGAANQNNNNTYHLLPIDINQLIEEIHIAPQAPASFIKDIKSLIKTYGCHALVKGSELLYSRTD